VKPNAALAALLGRCDCEAFQHRQVAGEADRDCGEDDVERYREAELNSGEFDCC
jgi:hypothetical protein